MGKLKLLEKKVQIISAIEKGSTFGGDIWQSLSPGRNIFQISQVYIDLKIDKLVMRTNPLLTVNEGEPLFIRLRYRNLIFRLVPGQFRLVGDKLVCDYPQEARALEPRTGERYVLPIGLGISLSMRRIERSIIDTPREIELRIIDFSEKGFGILISGANRDFLRSQDHFWLKAIDQRPLRAEILGCVTYVAPKGYYLRKGDVRVGLSLQRALNQDLYENLKKKCKVILCA